MGDHAYRRFMAAVLALSLLASCTSPRVTASPTESISTTPRPSATATPDPTRLMGTVLVPTLIPRSEFASLRINLVLPTVLGQPAESRVWRSEPFVADAAYVARAAAALGVTGPGVVGAAPGGNPPWRLWWTSDSALAVNTGSGEVLFFAGARDDGPHGAGPARADPSGALERLVAGIGSGATFAPTPGYVHTFRGAEATAALVEITGGTWTTPGSRDAAVLFPRYKDPLGLELTIYDTDEVGLFTSRLRTVGLVHRPLGRLVGGEIYAINTFGDAVKELGAAPERFLRFLSVAPNEPLTLMIDAATAVHGHAWAQSQPSDPRRAGRVLVPVWVFPAVGKTASGVDVTALLTVDAVVPQMRAQPASGALNIDADFLLRQQLAQLGGRRPEPRDPTQVAQDFIGPGCSAVELTAQDTDRYTGAATCNGQRVTFTVSRAFPALPESIWYVGDLRK
jgi:hypothetical protein